MSDVDLDPIGGSRVLGEQFFGGLESIGRQPALLGGILGPLIRPKPGTNARTRLTPPLLQGGAAIRRTRERGASLQPGQGQGFLGSIQAGADPGAFDQLLLSLANGGGLRGR